MEQSRINGVLPVYKPEGWTSFDIVAKVRSITGIRKIGHGGTLDPMASGVLPLFIGKAAKACDIVPDNRKSYIAALRFGETSDTLDATGTITQTGGRKVTEEELEQVLHMFVGELMQVPPMYSAIKVGGRRLYELAREGKTLDLPPRPVTVDSITLRSFDEKKQAAVIAVNCRKGTYIRALIRDIAEQLGTVGLMTDLERTYSGGFSLDECYTLAEITDAQNDRQLEELLLPTDKIFAVYDELTLGEKETRLYKNGVRLRAEQTGMDACGKTFRVYGADGEFLGLGKFYGDQFGIVKNFFDTQ